MPYKTPKYHKPQNQVLSWDFYASSSILRRSCYGLSRCALIEREYHSNDEVIQNHEKVSFRFMNAIAVTGSAHQSQEKKPTGTFSSLRGLSDRPEAGCGQGSSYSTTPMYIEFMQVYRNCINPNVEVTDAQSTLKGLQSTPDPG